ncbi:MAG: M48 family metallopeptidase [Pseudomonadota bacterium]
MTGEGTFSGVYYDGASARAHEADVSLTSEGVAFEAADGAHLWPFHRIDAEPAPNGGLRLSSKTAPGATLVLGADGAAALRRAAPDLFDGTRARRRFVALVAALVVAAAGFGGLFFFGVPAASGPLAKATDPKLEIQIGDNLDGQIGLILRSCKASEADALIEQRLNDMAGRADVGFPIRYEFIRPRMPNALALPGGRVKATRGLIDALGDDQEAFFAVMAHELGHVKERHGMQTIYRNAGLSTLLEIVTGGSGVAQQAILIGGQLNQLRYSRVQEEDADAVAFEIMEATGLDPAALARAFEAIADIEPEEESDEDNDGDAGDERLTDWLSTHPNTKDRIRAARDRARPDAEGFPYLDADEWAIVKSACDPKATDEPSDG